MPIQRMTSRTILSRVKEDVFFGVSYNMNLYRGCQHGCIYCDSRSACYEMDTLSNIYIKENALELLRQELAGKRSKGTIGTGSMNDPYMPIEASERLTRQALEILAEYRWPAYIITKSDLILRDIDVLRALSETYCAVSITLTTMDDDLARQIEPGAPLPSRRLEALRQLREAGIYAGVTFMPLLPFINDSLTNVKTVVDACALAGTQYILPYFGVTLRDGSREYFYDQLDRRFPGVKDRYEKTFGNQFGCNAPNAAALYTLFKERCKVHGVPARMRLYKKPAADQVSLF